MQLLDQEYASSDELLFKQGTVLPNVLNTPDRTLEYKGF